MSEHMTDEEYAEHLFSEEVDWAIFKGLQQATKMIHDQFTKCGDCPYLSPPFGDGRTICTIPTPCIHIRESLKGKYK